MGYTTGTIQVTNGSANIVGTGTAFVANVLVGDLLLGPDGRTYEVLTVASNTALTIGPNYSGSNASGQAYRITPTQGRIVTLTQSVNALLTDFSAVRDGIGAGNFPDGSAAAPAFRFGADTDTGFYRPASNVLGLSTAGVERMRATSTGVGFSGVSAPFSPYCSVEITSAADAATLSIGTSPGASNRGLEIYGDITAIPAAQVRGYIATGNSAIGVAGDLLIAPRTSASANIRFISGTTPAEVLRITATGTVQPGGSATQSLGTASLRWQNLYVSTIIQPANVALTLSANSYLWAISPSSGAYYPGVDNSQSIGGASNRASVIYAGTGTINTSDARDKLWRGAADATELRAAKRIAAELGFYQWLAKIDEYGADNARFHFGVRAQAVWAIMADEGLIDPLDDDGKPGATPYAFLCWDEWPELVEDEMGPVVIPAVIDEETGAEIEPARTEMQPTGETIVTREAGNRFGIRPDQLALFLIAAQEARLAAIESAL